MWWLEERGDKGTSVNKTPEVHISHRFTEKLYESRQGKKGENSAESNMRKKNK